MFDNWSEKYSSDEILSLIRKGKDELLEKIFLDYKDEFRSWAHHQFKVEHHLIEDCWQDAIIDFYENVVQGKVVSLSCSLKTYLFSIGKNKIRLRIRLEKKHKSFQDVNSVETNAEIGEPDPLNLLSDARKAQLQRAINSLTEKNRQLLIMRYYKGFSLEEIKEGANYQSINSVSASLSRALKNLKKLIHGKKMTVLFMGFTAFFN